MAEANLGVIEELHVQLQEMQLSLPIVVLLNTRVEITWIDDQGNIIKTQTVSFEE